MIKIKKYANRRLYNTTTSTYITQDDVVNLITNNEEFKIISAKNDNDITSQTLIQIILEKEINGSKMLPKELLKKIISSHQMSRSNEIYNFLKNITDFADANQMFNLGSNGEIKFNPFDFKEYFNNKIEKNNKNKKKDFIKSN